VIARHFWFIIWTIAVIILFAVSIFAGWSPGAEGRSGGSGGVFVRSGGGPNHK
jgi:hypothetical protein